MRLLFIKLKHIGDSLLLTPTLLAVRTRYPQAHISVVVRQGCQGILEGCPAIDQIFVTAAPEADRRPVAQLWDDLGLIRTLRREKFDYAFELGDGDRGRLLAILSGAKQRCTNQVGTQISGLIRRQFHCLSNFDWRLAHRVEKDFRTVSACLPLDREIPPLCFDQSRTQPWAPATSVQEFAVLHPGTRWQRKRWPIDRWLELTQRLLESVAHVIISSGPAPEERADAQRLQALDRARVLATNGQANWAQLAGLLYRACLFVGVDTAAMHLAAACQCPTVAILGPSVESAWRPWRTAHRLVMAREAVIPTDTPDYFRIKEKLDVSSVVVEDVWNACAEMLQRKTAARLPARAAREGFRFG